MCSDSEGGSYLRLIDSCITQLKAQRPSRTCKECTEKEEEVATVHSQHYGVHASCTLAPAPCALIPTSYLDIRAGAEGPPRISGRDLTKVLPFGVFSGAIINNSLAGVPHLQDDAPPLGPYRRPTPRVLGGS